MSDNRWRDWEIGCGSLAAILAGVSMGIVDLQTPLSNTLQTPLYELGMSDIVGGFSAALVNGVGHILPGALLIIAAIARLFNPARSNKATGGALLVAGLFWAALGFTPARYGDEEAMVVHGIWMIGFQLSAAIALLLLAWDARGAGAVRSLLLAVGAALVLASPLSGLRGLPVPGLLERIGIGAYFGCILFQAHGLWRMTAGGTPHTATR